MAVRVNLRRLKCKKQNLEKFGLKVIVALNKFTQDTPKEIELLELDPK